MYLWSARVAGLGSAGTARKRAVFLHVCNGPGCVASALVLKVWYPGDQQLYHLDTLVLEPHTEFTESGIPGWGQATCVLTIPPTDSDAPEYSGSPYPTVPSFQAL